MVKLIEATSNKEFKTATQLFREYAAEIGIDLSFQKFDDEIMEIEQQYSRPNGQLFIAYDNSQTPVGCFGIRKLTDSICELKRMYVKKAARGKGIGEKLLKKALEAGRESHYQAMRLDTLPAMKSAVALYKKMGFYEIEAYRFNPIKGAKYFEIQL